MFVGRCLDSARHDKTKSHVRRGWISRVVSHPGAPPLVTPSVAEGSAWEGETLHVRGQMSRLRST